MEAQKETRKGVQGCLLWTSEFKFWRWRSWTISSPSHMLISFGVCYDVHQVLLLLILVRTALHSQRAMEEDSAIEIKELRKSLEEKATEAWTDLECFFNCLTMTLSEKTFVCFFPGLLQQGSGLTSKQLAECKARVRGLAIAGCLSKGPGLEIASGEAEDRRRFEGHLEPSVLLWSLP